MKARNSDIEVIDRKVLKDYFKETATNIEDLRVESACLRLAQDLGATEMIRANLVEDTERRLRLMVRVAGLAQAFGDEAQFVITKDNEDLLSQPVPLFSRPPDSIPVNPDVPLIPIGSKGIDGVTEPLCISCPDPKFSELGRMARVNGSVELSAVVDTAGDVTSVYFVNGLPLGLTQVAIDTVKGWKFRPALKNGRPIEVRVDIELTFKTAPLSPG